MRVGILVTLLGLAACPGTAVRRAATVPHPAPGMQTGFAQERMVEAFFTLPAVLDDGAPAPGEDDGAGIAVPRRGVAAGIRVSQVRGWDVGFLWEQWLGQTKVAMSADQPDNGGRDPIGLGVTAHSGSTRRQGFAVGGEGTFLLYILPYRVLRDCSDAERSCWDDFTGEFEGADRSGIGLVPLISIGITPSYRAGPVVAFASLTLRNHPSAVRRTTPSWDEGVDVGPVVVLAAVGVEVTLPAAIRLLAQVYDDLDAGALFGDLPAVYTPTLALSAVFPLDPNAPPEKSKRPAGPPRPAPRVAPPRPRPVENAPPPIIVVPVAPTIIVLPPSAPAPIIVPPAR